MAKALSPEERAEADEENLLRSVRRTQAEIRDLIECNDFEWFGTFTFDPAKINRYDETAVRNAMANWLNRQRKRNSPDLKYLLVPERHKDGAIHFHALLANFNGKMADSGRKWRNRTIFNLSGFSHGFTNFTEIEDLAKTANYCRKYITKEIASTTTAGAKRYWHSRNLQKPLKKHNETLETIFSHHQATLETSDLERAFFFENDFVEVKSFPIKRK